MDKELIIKEVHKRQQKIQNKMLDYVKENFDLKTVKLYWGRGMSIRVVLPDEEEIMIIYDHHKEEIVERSIGKVPILKCRDCDITFGIKGQFCNCIDDKLFVDIDDMYYYIRVGGNFEKLIIVRDSKNNGDKPDLKQVVEEAIEREKIKIKSLPKEKI